MVDTPYLASPGTNSTGPRRYLVRIVPFHTISISNLSSPTCPPESMFVWYCAVLDVPAVPRPAILLNPSPCRAPVASTSQQLEAPRSAIAILRFTKTCIHTTQHASIYHLYAHDAEDSASQANDESTRTQGLGCRIQAELCSLGRGGGGARAGQVIKIANAAKEPPGRLVKALMSRAEDDTNPLR